MDTTQAFLWLGIGFGLLLVGAEVLVRAASKIGLGLGMRPLTVGATIVAFGTSAPEFLVSIVAGVKDKPDIAIGNLIGSNIANIGLVLGIAALVRAIPIDRRVLRLEYPVALIATVAVPIVAWNDVVTRTEGIYLLAGFVMFLTLYVLRASRGKGAAEEVEATPQGSLGLSVLIACGGLGMLIFGSNMVVDSAEVLAIEFGFSKAAVGATVLALGTSLPEVATSVVAAVRGHHGIAIGNVLGSNVFNLLFVLGPAALINADGLPVGQFEKEQLIWLMVGMTVLLFPVMRFGPKISRWEGVGMLGAYGFFLFLMQQAGRVSS